MFRNLRSLVQNNIKWGKDSDGDAAVCFFGKVSFVCYKGETLITKGNVLVRPVGRWELSD